MIATDQPEEQARLAQILRQNVSVVSATISGDTDATPPMTALLSARMAADAIEQATSVLVAQSRRAGRTWQEIGELLSITRQAAQQRFNEGTSDPQHAALASRAAEVVSQINAGAWAEVTADWDEVMRTKLSVDQLAETWQQIVLNTGPLQTIGQSSVTQKGPYRIVDLPLLFMHGPMKARVAFNHDQKISGLFVLLPDAP
jgi:hypothetical protein